MIRIVIADNNHIVRRNIHVLLEDESDFNVLAEAEDGQETLRMVERFHPDILLLDLVMPEMNGFEVARVVSKRFPKTKIIILTIHANDAYVLKALEVGALGYVLKESSSQELVYAIREAAIGRCYLSPPFSIEMIEAYKKRLVDKN